MKGHTKLEYELIKLEFLNECAEGATVDIASLVEQGVATKANKQRNQAKVIANGELTVKNLTVKAHAFTAAAKAAIEANGGTCILMSPTRPIPLEQVIGQSDLKFKLRKIFSLIYSPSMTLGLIEIACTDWKVLPSQRTNMIVLYHVVTFLQHYHLTAIRASIVF